MEYDLTDVAPHSPFMGVLLFASFVAMTADQRFALSRADKNQSAGLLPAPLFFGSANLPLGEEAPLLGPATRWTSGLLSFR